VKKGDRSPHMRTLVTKKSERSGKKNPFRRPIWDSATSSSLNYYFYLFFCKLQRHKWQGEEKIEEKEED